MLKAPEPGIPDMLLAYARTLVHVVVTRTAAGLELGDLRSKDAPWTLAIVGGEQAGEVEWALLDEDDDAPGVIPVLLTVLAGEVLRCGRLGAGNWLEHAGKSYRLCWFWAAGNVRRLYADAVEV